MAIIKYEHHDNIVCVQEHLEAKHKDHCLCFQGCVKFKPENVNNNCRIANKLYEFDKAFGLVTPVWECPEFKVS